MLLSRELIMLHFLVDLVLRFFLKLVKISQQHVNRKNNCCVHQLVLMKFVRAVKEQMLRCHSAILLLPTRVLYVVRQYRKVKENHKDLLWFSVV